MSIVQEIPLVLSVQACKPAAMHILCEMPGNLDIDGDSGVIGRICRPLSSAQKASKNSGSLPAEEHVCMDLKGIDISSTDNVMHPIGSTVCNLFRHLEQVFIVTTLQDLASLHRHTIQR